MCDRQSLHNRAMMPVGRQGSELIILEYAMKSAVEETSLTLADDRERVLQKVRGLVHPLSAKRHFVSCLLASAAT